MQITDQVYYNQRALYYWAKLYANQLGKGDRFDDLKKTICINILNFNYFDDAEEYHNIFKVLNVKTYADCFEELELHFIELKKFNKELQFISTALDRWSTFLKNAHKYDRYNLPEELKQAPAIEKAFECLENIHLGEEEEMIYEARLKWLRDEEAAIKKAEIKGQEKGREQGREEGREEGIEIGAKAERTAMINNMLKNNLTLDRIAEITGLSVDVIKEITVK
jgi:predicted transposase/invertase (TIGR01784 family)